MTHRDPGAAVGLGAKPAAKAGAKIMDNGGLERAFGRVEGQLTGLSSQVAALATMVGARLDEQAKRMDNHSERLRKVENRQHWLLGIAAAVATAASALASGAWSYFSNVLK